MAPRTIKTHLKTEAQFKEFLKTRIIGADDALVTIYQYIQGHALGLRYPEDPPIGCFLLLGPTGVGKTKTVEVIAEWLHGSPKNVLRINCAEYNRSHEVAKLIGSPPGYLGHRETTPQLSMQKLNAITSERSNISVVLFDEIEKADEAVYQLLLGVMDKGELKLGDNTSVRFQNSLIFFTSNLGTQKIQSTTGFLRSPQKLSQKAETARIDAATEAFFTTEWLNRISERFYYKHLTREQIGEIVNIELNILKSSMYERHRVMVTFSDAAKKALVDAGFSQDYGARELQRTIRREIIHGVLTGLMEDVNIRNQCLIVNYNKGKFSAALQSAAYEE